MALVTSPGPGVSFGSFDKEKFAAQAHKKFVTMVEQERRQHHSVLHDDAGGSDEAGAGPAVVSPLTVVVRKRPMNASEHALGQYDVVSVPDARRIVVHEPKVKYDLTQAVVNHGFAFDRVFHERDSTLHMYKALLRPLVLNLDRGAQVTAFAYGQTVRQCMDCVSHG
jgi:hypothetical protein